MSDVSQIPDRESLSSFKNIVLTENSNQLPHCILIMGNKFGPPVVMGDESIMSKKAHGTSAV